MSAPAPRVRVEPHGPGRVLVLITRRDQRAFALSHAEAAWLAGALTRYLAGLPEAEARILVAELAGELAGIFGGEALSGSQSHAAARPGREHEAGADRQPRAERAAPAARFVAPPGGRQ